MTIQANKLKEIARVGEAVDARSDIDDKIETLMTLLAENEFDSETVKKLKTRFDEAITHKSNGGAPIEAFKIIDENVGASREELLDDFSALLLSNKFDSTVVKKRTKGELLIKIVLILLGTVMITLGFAMIVMPAPPYFEMFTIFYFNRDDGVTLMDLISLTIVLAGVYILVRGFLKKTKA